jgi:hypothetical protein
VTIPRFTDGIPITLGYVKSPASDLQITPYPNYDWHSSNGANCNLMSSVLRVAIDDCKHLWVLDTGVINNDRKCPPQLFIFNLRTDKLVRNYKFPQTQYNDLSLFITPVGIRVKATIETHQTNEPCLQILDVKDPSPNCENTKAYIADVTGFALIVYDYTLNKSWKIQNKLVSDVKEDSLKR